MSRRDDTQRGYLQIDRSGRATVIGSGLREDLRALPGVYTHLPSDANLLHFQRAAHTPPHEELRDPVIFQGDISGVGSTIEIINFVNSAQLSGTMVFASEDQRKTLHFKRGELRGAQSNQTEDRLGEVMFRFGVLTRAQLESTLESCRRARRPLGNYLVEQGLVTQAELYLNVRRQVEEIFFSILSLNQGDFYLTAFDVDQLRSPLTLNTQTLLMDGLRRMDELSHFRKRIPSPETRLIARPGQPAPPEDTMEARVYAHLSEPRTAAEVSQHLRAGEFDALKCLYQMLQSRHVELMTETPEAAEPGDSEVAAGGEEGDETSAMVDTFNAVFQRIYHAISRHGKQDALDQGLETFLQFYGFVELFQGVAFDNEGRLDKTKLLINLHQNQVENHVSFLSQALNELLFFEMFAAREWLEREEQQELQKIINQLFIEIG